MLSLALFHGKSLNIYTRFGVFNHTLINFMKTNGYLKITVANMVGVCFEKGSHCVAQAGMKLVI